MRTVRRLRLRILLDLRSSPTVLSTLLLVALSNLGQARQKHTIPSRALRGFFHLGQLCAYGGPGGIRTPVQDTVLITSYSNNSQYIFILGACQLLWR